LRPSSVAANARTMQRARSFAWVCGAISACGGGAAGQPTDAGSAFDAGVRLEGGAAVEASAALDAMEDAPVEATPSDAGTGELPQCPPPKPATCAAIEACLAFVDGAVDGGGDAWLFDDQSFMTNFFRVIAVQHQDCTSLSTCTYDPFAESNALGQLVGPDGLAYVWTYLPSRSEYVLVREDRNPTGYDIVVEVNECEGDGRIGDGGTE
jgi:hypothetical protein